MEVQLDRHRQTDDRVVPSAMTISTDVYWIPMAHDASRSTNVSTSKVSHVIKCRLATPRSTVFQSI